MKRMAFIWAASLGIILGAALYDAPTADAHSAYAATAGLVDSRIAVGPVYECDLKSAMANPWICEEQAPAGYITCGRCAWSCSEQLEAFGEPLLLCEQDLEWMGCWEREPEETFEDSCTGDDRCDCEAFPYYDEGGCVFIPDTETCDPDNQTYCPNWPDEGDLPLYCEANASQPVAR